mgnify:FL=1
MAGREETEAKREKELVALRKKYLAKKAKDKKSPSKKKVVRLDLSREGVETSRRKKLDDLLAKSKKGVSKSLVPKARKFKEEVKKVKKEVVKLNKELTKAKKETDSDRVKTLKKKMEADRLAFKKKERQGKGIGFRISGATNADIEFIMKMLEK